MLVLEGEAHNGLPGRRQYPARDDVDIGIAREDFASSRAVAAALSRRRLARSAPSPTVDRGESRLPSARMVSCASASSHSASAALRAHREPSDPLSATATLVNRLEVVAHSRSRLSITATPHGWTIATTSGQVERTDDRHAIALRVCRPATAGRGLQGLTRHSRNSVTFGCPFSTAHDDTA